MRLVKFGALENIDVQTALALAVKENPMIGKYRLIGNLKQVNKNFKNALVLNDIQTMEMYFEGTKNPSWFKLIKHLSIFRNIKEEDYTKVHLAMWATFLIYSFYLKKKLGIRNVYDQFGMEMWEMPGPLRPSNRILMDYIKMISKPTLDINSIYNFCYSKFTLEQLLMTFN